MLLKSKVILISLNPQSMDHIIFKRMKKVFALLGGIESFCNKEDRILVKPNISGLGIFTSTNPRITWAVAKIFSEYGCETFIGDDPVIPISEKEAYENYNLYDIAKCASANVISLRHSPHIIVKTPENSYFKELEISEYALDFTIIVNIAKMKSTNIVTATLGLKNMKGLLSHKWRRKIHGEGLNQGIVDLNKTVKATITIIDATLGSDGARNALFPVGLIMASTDTVAVDSIAARIMGYNPNNIEHIKLAYEKGLGHIDNENISIIGDNINKYLGKFKFSHPKNPFEIANEVNGSINVIQGNPCCSCLNQLGEFLYQYQERFSDIGKINILVGAKIKKESINKNKKIICYGNCTKKYKDIGIFIEGCPPTNDQAVKTGSLKKYFDELIN